MCFLAEFEVVFDLIFNEVVFGRGVLSCLGDGGALFLVVDVVDAENAGFLHDPVEEVFTELAVCKRGLGVEVVTAERDRACKSSSVIVK